MWNVKVLELTLKLSFTNGVMLKEYSCWSNLANNFISTCYLGTDSADLKPFTRISCFSPGKFKRCAMLADTHDLAKQEKHITTAVVNSVHEPTSN